VQIASAQKQIDDGETELAAGQAEYDTAAAKYEYSKQQYADVLTYVDDLSATLNQIDDGSQAQIDSINYRLATDSSLTDQQRVDFQYQINTLKANQKDARTGLAELNSLNSSAKQSMQDAESQLAAAKAKLDESRAKLEKAKADLAQAKADAAVKFAAAEKDIAEGTAEYNSAKADFDAKKAEGDAQIEDAKAQVIRGENKIELLSKPNYYVLDRTKLYSYADYSATADQMDAIARIFPVFFFFVAILVCLTTMTRMVDEQRGTIGTFKALGYKKREIVSKYVNYAALASVIGACTADSADGPVRCFRHCRHDGGRVHGLQSGACHSPRHADAPESSEGRQDNPDGTDPSDLEPSQLQPEGDGEESIPIQEKIHHDHYRNRGMLRPSGGGVRPQQFNRENRRYAIRPDFHI